jgi:hypothetical protein
MFFLSKGAIDVLLSLFMIWHDTKLDSTNYKRKLIHDSNSFHLKECEWYLDYPKDNIPVLDATIKEKNDFGFMDMLKV